MRCPSCGYEAPYANVCNGQRYRKAVEERLTEYGYPERMTPQKHQAAAAVRKVINIRFCISAKAGGCMLADDAKKAIEALDFILPRTEGASS